MFIGKFPSMLTIFISFVFIHFIWPFSSQTATIGITPSSALGGLFTLKVDGFEVLNAPKPVPINMKFLLVAI